MSQRQANPFGIRDKVQAIKDQRAAESIGSGETAPPPMPNAAGQATAARAAGIRARRRGAGSSVLTGLPVTGGGAARVRTRTLLGS